MHGCSGMQSVWRRRCDSRSMTHKDARTRTRGQWPLADHHEGWGGGQAAHNLRRVLTRERRALDLIVWKNHERAKWLRWASACRPRVAPKLAGVACMDYAELVTQAGKENGPRASSGRAGETTSPFRNTFFERGRLALATRPAAPALLPGSSSDARPAAAAGCRFVF